jgi:hypothetical protein
LPFRRSGTLGDDRHEETTMTRPPAAERIRDRGALWTGVEVDAA